MSSPSVSTVGSETPASTGGDTDEFGAGSWTDAQQKQLEDALRKFPASLPAKDRWKLIAGEVEGKSMKECVARFKGLRAALQQKSDA